MGEARRSRWSAASKETLGEWLAATFAVVALYVAGAREFSWRFWIALVLIVCALATAQIVQYHRTKRTGRLAPERWLP